MSPQGCAVGNAPPAVAACSPDFVAGAFEGKSSAESKKEGEITQGDLAFSWDRGIHAGFGYRCRSLTETVDLIREHRQEGLGDRNTRPASGFVEMVKREFPATTVFSLQSLLLYFLSLKTMLEPVYVLGFNLCLSTAAIRAKHWRYCSRVSF